MPISRFAQHLGMADTSPMSPEELKEHLARMARDLGFGLFGVAPATPPDRAEYIRAWIADGRHGGMEWLARGIDRRLDPQSVLPGARSLIVLGLAYHPPDPADPSGIAAYARGDDYHRVIEPRLRSMAAWLQSQSGAAARAYVDTGPIIERDAAARAGIGWIGKSTMLISHGLGTWFFLAAIITDAALPIDAPAPDRCGRCTRCIVACPTGAIAAPYQLDPRLCIAYLTIEHRGPIPEHLRPAIGTRIFGCDDCLAACPWNRFAQASRESALRPRPLPPLRHLLSLSRAQFDATFAGSPIRRARWEGFLRNVCIALGNSGVPSDIPALESVAASSPPPVPEHALWAIRTILARGHDSKAPPPPHKTHPLHKWPRSIPNPHRAHRCE